MQNHSYLHAGFGEYVYLGGLVGIFKNLAGRDKFQRTMIISDTGVRYTSLRSETLINRVNTSRGEEN